jgi:fumarylacetoacetate (FAA) hydrolase family protein
MTFILHSDPPSLPVDADEAALPNLVWRADRGGALAVVRRGEVVDQQHAATHRLGDHVTLSSPARGRLVNTVRGDAIPSRTDGAGALLKHLRGGRMQH